MDKKRKGKKKEIAGDASATAIKPTLGLCMIVKPSDSEAELLYRCLKHVWPYVDEIFITVTGENAAVESVCREFGSQVHVSHYTWNNHFADARNFNFSQSTCDYNLWLDADDVVKQPWLLPKIMERIGDGSSIIDAVVFDYLYDFDPETKVCTVKHLKTRIVKNDGCVTWVGALHEDFERRRELSSLYNQEVEILHLPEHGKDTERTERNVQIAEANYGRFPTDPRSLWLLARAYAAAGRIRESVDRFLSFVEQSGSDEERFSAYISLADHFRFLSDLERAKESALQAMKLKPWYPDSYISLGRTYFQESKMHEAETMLLLGIRLAAEDKRYEKTMIAWNPRDYDVNPLFLLSSIYMNLYKPREAKQCLETVLKVVPNHPKAKDLIDLVVPEIEKLEKIQGAVAEANVLAEEKDFDGLRKFLDGLPVDYRSHPGISFVRNKHFVKRESSGRDLTFFCSFTDEEWNPDLEKTRGTGGSEEAVINLSRRLAARGWNVTVYASMGHEAKQFDGVTWKPWWEWNFRDKTDVTVIWRHPKPVDYRINSTVTVIDLHDVHTYPYEFSEQRQKLIDKIFVKSDAHRHIIQERSGIPVPDEKFVVVPNGINPLSYNPAKKDPYLLINTSSPDRSLETLMDLFLEAREQLPDDVKSRVKLAWYYGWSVFDSVYKNDVKHQAWKSRVMEKFNKLIEQGIAEGGTRLPKDQINDLYERAGAFLYPTIFYEIHCISAAKAQAAGAVPIVTDFGALYETVKFGLKTQANELQTLVATDTPDMGLRNPEARQLWVRSLIAYLTHAEKFDDERRKMSSWANEAYDWERIADKWDVELRKLLDAKHGS